MKLFIATILLFVGSSLANRIKMCFDNSQCLSNEKCVKHRCVPRSLFISSIGPSQDRETCFDNNDCGPLELCKIGICVPDDLSATIRPFLNFERQCILHEDCDFGEFCREGLCDRHPFYHQPSSSGSTWTLPVPSPQKCKRDWECGFESICEDGFCLRFPLMSQNFATECPAGQEPRDGKCVSNEICKTHKDCPMNHACNFVSGGTGLKRCLWQDPGQKRFGRYNE